MAKPITPDEVAQKKKESLPKEVIEAFNELIVKNWDGYSATVKQPDVVGLICSKMNIPSEHVYNNHWLNVESVFQKAGWNVGYDKPGLGDDYQAFYEFTKKKRKNSSEDSEW